MNGLISSLDSRWFLPVLLWSLVWKALALWKSARKGHKYWFGAILVLNSMGLLEIIYLVLNRDKKKPDKPKVKKTSGSTKK